MYYANISEVGNVSLNIVESSSTQAP